MGSDSQASDDATLAGAAGTPRSTQSVDDVRFVEGETVGRYVLGKRLGAGGMGVVYAAHDPQLDRTIALKVLRPFLYQGRRDGKRVLMREAQALARLSHANVVTIFDVGTDGELVFLAMELIDGTTLSTWLSEQEPTRREILRVFVDAGRGLAAAHALGIVHRDFKPANIMIDVAGRVRVMDFGLARTGPDFQPERGSGLLTADALGTGLTDGGSALGTPAYMSPEAHLRTRVGPESDQFSFCVALWEGLFGERPFAGTSPAELALSITRGTIREPPRTPDAPRHVVSVLRRGLSVAGEDRWPSMEALLHALQRDPSRTRGIAVVAGGGAVLLSAVVGVPALQRARAEAECRRHADSIRQAWNEDVDARIGDAFTSTGLAYAGETWARAGRSLDDWIDAWQAARRETCGEPSATGDASARQACLDAQRLGLETFLTELERPDAAAVEAAAPFVAGLPAAAECTGIHAAQRHAALPDDPRLRAKVEGLQRRLQVWSAKRATGRARDSLDAAQEVLAEAQRIGWVPLEVEARSTAASSLARLGDAAAAAEQYEAAFHAAAGAGLDLLALDAATQLIFVVGHDQARHDDAMQWARVAEARIDRLGLQATPHAARARLSRAIVHAGRGELEPAFEDVHHAIELLETTLGSAHPETVDARSNLAKLDWQAGRYTEAAALYTQAIARYEEAYGASHPMLMKALGGLGAAKRAMGDNEAALEDLRRAYKVGELAYGPQHPQVAANLDNIGSVLRGLGRYDEARATHEDALRRLEAAHEVGHPQIGRSLNNLGIVLLLQQDYEAALPIYRRALEVLEGALGDEHPDVASPLTNLGLVHTGLGNHAEAQAVLERALAILEKAVGEDHPAVGNVLDSLAGTLLEQGTPQEALPVLRRAETIREATNTRPEDRASTWHKLAQAIWDTGGDRREARRFAERALEAAGEADRAPIEAWLETHRLDRG